MASTALLPYILIAIFNIVGSVEVSPPPSLHQSGNRTEAEPILQPVSWFPAISFKDPCNATEPPESAVIGPLDDSVCGGVSKRQNFFCLQFWSIQVEPGQRICVCVGNIGTAGSGFHRLRKA